MKKRNRKIQSAGSDPIPNETECHPADVECLYHTSNIDFTAFLRAKDVLIVETSRDATGRFQWVFNLGKLNSHQLFNEFSNGGLVSGIRILFELKNLKAQIRLPSVDVSKLKVN